VARHVYRAARALAVLAASVSLLACTSGSGAASARPGAATHTVVMDGTRFQPESLTIKAGDRVVWVNKDLFPHTATSERGRFDSDDIAPGQSWTFTPAGRGEIDYVCTLHRTMKAKLRVE
jgi:plastocyanin